MNLEIKIEGVLGVVDYKEIKGYIEKAETEQEVKVLKALHYAYMMLVKMYKDCDCFMYENLAKEFKEKAECLIIAIRYIGNRKYIK